MTRKELSAAAMSCDHCKMTIEHAVKELPGIGYVSANPESKKVVIEFDEKKISLDAIKKAIEDSGYDLTE